MNGIESGFFSEGENCWRIAGADRFAILIDAQNYYSAFLASVQKARHSIFILGWDIDTRVSLQPGSFGYEERYSLGHVLKAAVNQNPELEIQILCWDFAMLYSLERELLPWLHWNLVRHPRIHFVIDGRHPLGACHHQKMVVIDDRLAFVGGLDLCGHRWDTRSHRLGDRRRRDRLGTAYRPFHDTQSVFEGEAARSISELARERWRAATGGTGPKMRDSADGYALWPDHVQPMLSRVKLAIARTQHGSQGPTGIREIERLYIQSIRLARRYVYIENQYFTSERVFDAIRERLSHPDCPEFLLILPKTCLGWLEEWSMGTLRNRLLRKLYDSDPRGRVRLYYPRVEATSSPVPVVVHSKLMIVDDRILRIGSSNLSNRSMGLDTECDVAISSDGVAEQSASERELISEAIFALRSSLLAEHLGAIPERVAELTRASGSLFRVVDELSRSDARASSPEGLTGISWKRESWIARITPDASVLDPDGAIERDPIFSHFVPKEPQRHLSVRFHRLKIRLFSSAVIGFLLAIKPPALPLGSDLSWGEIILYTALACLCGAILTLPIDVLIFASCLAFGGFAGAVGSWLGIAAAGLTLYLAGMAAQAFLNPKLLPGPEPHLKNAQDGGFWPNLLLHVSVIAPFGVLSYRSGLEKTSPRWFATGLVMGQALRIPVVAGFAAVVLFHWRERTWLSGLALALSTFAVYLLFRALMRRLLPIWSFRKTRESGFIKQS